jgi:hypothetical protein
MLGAGCASVTRVNADAPLDPSQAYVARFHQRHSWRSFEDGAVTSAGSPGRGATCARIQRGDELVSCVPPGRQRLLVEIRASAESILQMPGMAQVSLEAELKGGTRYAVALRRQAGDRIEIWIYECATGAVASAPVSVEVRHPVVFVFPVRF